MKEFLEDYGFAILITIVVILLIAMCTPVRNTANNHHYVIHGIIKGDPVSEVKK